MVNVLEADDLLSLVLKLVLVLHPCGGMDIVVAAAVCKRWAAAAASVCNHPPAHILDRRMGQESLVAVLRSSGSTSKGLAVLVMPKLYGRVLRVIQHTNGNYTNPCQRELLALDLLEVVLEVLQAHPTSKGVQAHGLMLLALFVKARDPPAIASKESLLMQGVVGVLVCAMRTHPMVAVSPASFDAHGSIAQADGYFCCQELACRVLQGLVRHADDGWQPKLRRASAALEAVPLLAKAIRNVLAFHPCVTDSQCDNILIEGVKAYGAILYAAIPTMAADEASTHTTEAASLLERVRACVRVTAHLPPFFSPLY